MSSSRLALLFLAAFAIGVATRAWRGSDGSTVPQDGPRASESSSDAHTASDVPSESAPAPNSAPGFVPTSKDHPLPGRAGGEGFIAGVLRREQGVPVAGVELMLRPSSVSGRFPPTPRGTKPENFIAQEHARQQWRAQPRRAVTDDEGRFRFDDLADLSWRLEADSNRWLVWTDDYDHRIESLRPTKDIVPVEAREAGRVAIQVEGFSGEEPVEVKLRSVESGGIRTFRGPFPDQLQLSPQRCEIFAVANTLASRPVPVDVVAGRDTSIVLVAEPAATLRGRLVDSDGWLTKGETVYVAPSDGDLIRVGDRIESKGWFYGWGGFRYEIHGLTAGQHAVAMRRPGEDFREEPEVIALVDLDLGENQFDITINAPATEGIPIDFVDLDGELLPITYRPNLFMTLKGQGRPRSVESKEEDGSLFLTIDEELDKLLVAAGDEATMYASAKVYGISERVPFDRSTERIRLPFPSPGHVVVRVVDAAGAPARALPLMYAVESTDPRMRTNTLYLQRGVGEKPNDITLDAEGRSERFQLQSGEYRAVARSGFRWVRENQSSAARYAIVSKTFSVVANEEIEVELRVPELHRLEVRYPDATGPRSIRIRNTEAERGPSGLFYKVPFPFVLDGLPAGRYVLQLGDLSGSNGAFGMFVSVQGDTTVDFEGRTPTAYRVTLGSPTSGLARAGLRTGDRIVGVDEPFESVTEAYRDFRDLQGKTLIVERAGAEIRVPWKSKHLEMSDGDRVQVDWEGAE